MNIWRKIRIVVFILFFIQGFLGVIFDLENMLASEPLIAQMTFIIVPLLFFPLGLLLIIGIQYINPLQDKQWTLPSMDSNFFNLKDPLHFFHAGAYFFAAAGIGMIVGSLFKGLSTATIGLGLLSASFGLLLGVKICIRVYDKKFREVQKIPTTKLRKGSVVNKTVKVIGTLMVIAAVVAIIVGTFSLIKTRDFLVKAVKADGKIVELDRKNSGDGLTYSPVFSFMDASGKEHIIHSSLSTNPPQYEIGEKVSVLYDPQYPRKARIDSFLNLYFVPLVMGTIGGINLLIGLFLIFLIPVVMCRINRNDQSKKNP